MAITFATYIHGSLRMQDYVAPVFINAGDVVVTGVTPRVAHLDIQAGELGALAVQGGVYSMPKSTAAASAIADNTLVFWDAANKVITVTSAGNKRFGYTFGASVDADPVQRVFHSVG